MRESENMNTKEESQENHSSLKPSTLSSFTHTHHQGEDAESENDLLMIPESGLDPEEQVESESTSHETNKKKKEHKDKHQIEFDSFLNAFQNESNLDEKLQSAIQFMENSLAQGGTPHFRNFWEARRLCLPLFKENISSNLRTQLWNKYSELSKEARRLKDILDEQSAFAVEQIEIAVKALEEDIRTFDSQLERNGFAEGFLFPQVLESKRESYESLQKQLNVLNVQASRINALRKELLKTEMRVRQKNKFFQRLSTAGDHVFPRRKELIKQVSSQFADDVNSFVKGHFQEYLNHDPSLYALREEIKALQGLAKVLTLNTNAFTQTRMRLSECWDEIKVKEKERKKERAQLKVAFKQNAGEVYEKIKALKEEIESGALSIADSTKKIEEISSFMRAVELGREEVKDLKDHLQELRKQVHEKIKAEEEVKHQQENERNRQKRERYKALKEGVLNLIRQQEALDADRLMADRDNLANQIQESVLTKSEKLELERLLKPLKDVITDKKEKALLDLSDNDRETLQQLQDILKQRKTRRQEVKNQLEALRKASGSSSLDFEKAMSYNAQINEEKERLDKIGSGIKEIEDKIAELQSKKA